MFIEIGRSEALSQEENRARKCKFSSVNVTFEINNNNNNNNNNDDDDDNNNNNNNNNGNFICVFECTIVNLATYRQFTNTA